MIADTAHTTGTFGPNQVLKYAALVQAAAFLVHTADHFRRGLDVLTTEVFWLGTAASVLAIVAIAIALMGLPLAPLLAVVHGFSRAAGVAAVHLLRPWGPISDSLHHGADIVSWVAVLAEIAGALTLGLAGAYALRLREQNGVARDVPGIPTLVE